ncbi:MAG: CopD family protein [Thermodesulfovibrionales bacterium]|nr:CopD family protein [Thermodesulfovibrionales bacterium]
MREIILAVSYWLHLTATVVWIGGIAFILFIAIPSAKQVLGADAGKLMGEISKRFTPIANYSIIFIVVTGAALTGFNKQFSGIGNFGNSWSLTLIMKHVLVFVMVAVHFYRGLILAPKIARTETVSKKTSLQKLSLNLVKVNFCLGVMVLLLSGIMSVIFRYNT